MTDAPIDLILGPAVVVDDEVTERKGALALILDQLVQAGLPVVELTQLPSIESLKHWRQLGLIVLDWELSFAEYQDDPLPGGMTVPSVLGKESRAETYAFIRALLQETTAPIFIISDASTSSIQTALGENLADLGAVLDRRLKVYSKAEVQVNLLKTIGDWLSSRPALLALKAWNVAYTKAETATFQDFENASGDWVQAVHRSAVADGAKPEMELREILSRNVMNRVGEISFPSLGADEGSSPDGGGLRRVLSMGAVVPAHNLDADFFGTGDLFVIEGSNEPFQEIRVVVTPDCELVRAHEFRIVYLTASRVKDETLSANSAKRVAAVKKGSDGHIWTCLLTPDGHEYDIRLSGWQVAYVPSEAESLWPGLRRIGRLMEPYLSHLQQNFALNVSRKGLPRVPDDFYVD